MPSAAPSTRRELPGLTVKVYNGKNLRLPFSLISNEFILRKISDCAYNCDTNLLNQNIKQHISNQDESLNSAIKNINLNSNTNPNATNHATNHTTTNSNNHNRINLSILDENIDSPHTIHSSDSIQNNIDTNDPSNISSNNVNSNKQPYLSPEAATSCLPSIIAVPNTVQNNNNSTNSHPSPNPNHNNLIKNPLIYMTIEYDKTVSLVEPSSGLIKNPTFNNVSNFDVIRNGLLTIQLFVKIPNILIPKDINSIYKNKNNFNLKTPSQQILIGTARIPLNLNNFSSKKRLLNHEWLKLINDNVINGYISITIEYKPSSTNLSKSLSIDQFDLLKVIGKGSFGKVMQVRKKDTQRIYALKSIRKAHIVSRMEVIHTLAERTVLAKINNPFIVPLKFSFQSNEKLYFVLDFINGGELFHHLQKEGKFTLNRSRFYTAELLIALESLHSLNVIYRDLKPENILLDYQGHIALCDFGLCKLNMKNSEKTNTFCGTPEYLAPELLLNKGYTRSVDWWTLGVLLYEMLTGLPPFYDEDVPKMYKKILYNPLTFPTNFDPLAKDLISNLLSRDPEKRLGNGENGANDIKNHKFFQIIDWNKLVEKKYTPPFKPPVSDAFDTSNFDIEFTSERPADSLVDDYLSKSVQKQFEGWTYIGESRLA
ncbi:Pkinase-domain-containing protein [Ascoidea rubescens DSM 1968]|uniref:non-specific serine/threonine protein kinase n=1 Tax=Ascoidea rubescens DSM 1968 TaxID=1344418 RepID=A0A1D2VR97_9ASCO|nr:Pkinase-domain-containing protein [Ascoidea rubescens DSM 1968]ODV64131.1 Pkinase-domain-containing protein [Ascoidea rubescens DSM 1968]